jgi:predicted nucleic acid-binding protein
VKYFLDTNIFMYAAGQDHALKAPCVGILRRVANEELEAVTSTEVLQEILYRYGAIGETQRGLRLSRLAVDQVGGAVLPVTLKDMQRAFGLVERHGEAIAARDAVHAATMLNNGVTRLFSADTHFDVIAGITRVDPRTATRL